MTDADAIRRDAYGRRELAGIVALAVVALIAFVQSYARWLHPIIDSGRDLYIPEQLAQGAKLYRDLRYQYPPLAPYLLAAIVRVFGSSLAVYTIVGVVQSAAIAGALWMLARRFAGALGAFVAVLLFVAVNFAGASTGGSNFLFPYSYAATIGMAFLLACLVTIESSTILGLALALAASWCKLEYAAAVLVTLVALAIGRRISIRALFAFVIAAAASLGLAAIYFRDSAWLRDNVLSASLLEGTSARQFFANAGGTAQLAARAREIAIVVAIYAVIVLALRWFTRATATWQRVIAAAIAIGASVVIANFAFFRVWSLLHVVALVWALARERTSPLLLLSTASIAATLRIPLNIAPEWYGFALVLPTYLLIVYVLFRWLPERGVYSQRAALLWLPVILLIAGRTLLMQRDYYAAKEHPVETARGTYYDRDGSRADIFNTVIARLRESGGTLVVIPEGVTLNYFAGARTPLSFTSFIPVEVADPGVEDQILREFEARPPDRIAVVTRDVRQFGYRGFGVDYNQRLAKALGRRYRIEAQWQSSTFDLVLLRRAR